MTITADSSLGCPPPYTGVPDLRCLPRWGTARNPDRPTLGPKVAEVAERLGTPLMPWQRYVADVALEIDPETGLLAYQEVGVTVPRQQGKTTLALGVMAHRPLGFGPPVGPRQNILYTAQTRNDARKKWEDEHLPVLERSVFRSQFSVRKTNGNEAILWKNGSKHGITSSTEKAGHGEILDLGWLDEAFAQLDDRVEQAMKPAMVTRRNAQFYWQSTAGTRNSLYLLSKVETGRALVSAGVDRGVAYFEWSAAPEARPDDPRTWLSCMPALGLTVQQAAVETFQRSMRPAEFRRAFLNIADTESAEEWAVIPEEAWRALVDPASQAEDPVAFAADVTPDRSWAVITAAGRRPDGLMHVEVIDHRRGTGWVVDRMRELRDRWRPCGVGVDAAGPAGTLLAPFEAAGIDVVKPSARDAAHAAQTFYDGCGANPLVDEPAWIRHLAQPPLAAALAGAQKRNLGDGWAWARKGVSVDISPLVAASLAVWVHATRAHLAVESVALPVTVNTADGPVVHGDLWRPSERLSL